MKINIKCNCCGEHVAYLVMDYPIVLQDGYELEQFRSIETDEGFGEVLCDECMEMLE